MITAARRITQVELTRILSHDAGPLFNLANVSDHFDIVILGGGLNGAALASALRNGPQSVALVEPHPPSPPGSDAIWDSRIYAYSPGNVDWLQTLGAWCDPVRAQAV